MVSILLMSIIVLVQFMMKLHYIRLPDMKDGQMQLYKNQNTGSNYVNLGTFAGPPYFEDTETVIYAKKNVAIANFTPTVFGGGTLAYSAAGLPP